MVIVLPITLPIALANMTNSLTDSLANMTTPGGERSRSPQMVVLGLAVSLSLVRTAWERLARAGSTRPAGGHWLYGVG